MQAGNSDIANQFGWTEEELEAYEDWGIKEQDERGAIQYALRTGMEQGLQQGLEQGLEQGLRQGVRQERLDMAHNMLSEGFDRATISKISGLSLEEIAALVEEDEKSPSIITL